MKVTNSPNGMKTFSPVNASHAAQVVSESKDKAAPKKSPRMNLKSTTFQKDMELRQKYEVLISHGNSSPEALDKSLNEMRRLILLEGLPPETEVLTFLQYEYRHMRRTSPLASLFRFVIIFQHRLWQYLTFR